MYPGIPKFVHLYFLRNSPEKGVTLWVLSVIRHLQPIGGQHGAQSRHDTRGPPIKATNKHTSNMLPMAITMTPLVLLTITLSVLLPQVLLLLIFSPSNSYSAPLPPTLSLLLPLLLRLIHIFLLLFLLLRLDQEKTFCKRIFNLLGWHPRRC